MAIAGPIDDVLLHFPEQVDTILDAVDMLSVQDSPPSSNLRHATKVLDRQSPQICKGRARETMTNPRSYLFVSTDATGFLFDLE